MNRIPRRSFLQIAATAIPASTLLAQRPIAAPSAKPTMVSAGSDREGKTRAVGVSSTTYKVLTAETSGAMFVIEQANEKKGGPTRHLHFSQDELFYVLEGEYVIEVGAERFHLKAGDCVLGPRGIPHAWAFVGDSKGRMLVSYSPAGRMEAFFNDREKIGIKKGAYASTAEAETMKSYGMELVGPPLKIDEST
jgi:mannose-6-phosphate isomerase-like protein (cupin superfamily)